jgi:RNA 3'-terminal phosphate cyclase
MMNISLVLVSLPTSPYMNNMTVRGGTKVVEVECIDYVGHNAHNKKIWKITPNWGLLIPSI